jgi:hypothetical protein
MISPTARTLAKLRKEGWLPWVVEKWIPGANIRSDLFGFIDVLAIRGTETLGVQSTSRSNVASRVKKIAEHENVARVREAGWAIVVHGWAKNSKGRWECREVDCS